MGAPTNVAESTTMALLSGTVKQAKVQALLRDLGMYVGKAMLSNDDSSEAAKRLRAMNQPGTWEYEVLAPLVTPVLDGIYESGYKYAWLASGAAILMLAATNTVSFVLGRRSANKGLHE